MFVYLIGVLCSFVFILTIPLFFFGFFLLNIIFKQLDTTFKKITQFHSR